MMDAHRKRFVDDPREAILARDSGPDTAGTAPDGLNADAAEWPESQMLLPEQRLQQLYNLVSLLRQYARETGNEPLREQMALFANSKQLLDDLNQKRRQEARAIEMRRRGTGRGVRAVRPRGGFSLAVDTLLGIGDIYLNVLDARHRMQRQEAWVRIIQITRTIGIETYFEFGEYETMGRHYSRGLVIRALPWFVPGEDAAFRIRLRENLIDFMGSTLVRRHYPPESRLCVFLDEKTGQVEREVELLLAEGGGLPGIAGNLPDRFYSVPLADIAYWYRLLSIPPGVVNRTVRQMRS